MKPRPWLTKIDERWSQQLRWNISREILFTQWHKNWLIHDLAKLCPLIEEAQWFMSVVPKSCTAFSEEQIVDLFFKTGRTPRHVAYVGIITHNFDLIREAALNGDGAAQFKMAAIPGDHEHSAVWLSKSLAAGYSEAFKASAKRAIVNSDYRRHRNLLQQGIIAAAQSSIDAYVKAGETSEQEALYYTGQVWLMFHTNKELHFIKLVDLWYDKPHEQRDRTSGFIIGQIFHKLSPRQIDELTINKLNGLFYQALQVAHQMYLTMCERTQQSVVTWMLVSRYLPIVKDIRKVIAQLIWHNRDTE